MDIKKCEFDCPVKDRKMLGGLHDRMFNQDVGFRFEVNVKTTDPKEIQEMLQLFNKAAADFNETWHKEPK